MSILFLIISAVSAILAYKITIRVYLYYITWKTFSRVPGPPAVPVLGTLELRKLSTEEERLKYILTLGNKYKDGICAYWIGLLPIACLYDPNLIQVVLSSKVHVNKSHHYNLLSEWLGDGLITAAGEQWHKDRKLLTPTFHFNILEQFALTMSERAESMIKCLEEKIAEDPQQQINIVPYITKVTGDIILEPERAKEFDCNSKYLQNISRTMIKDVNDINKKTLIYNISETAMGITSNKDMSEYTKAVNRYLDLFSMRINTPIYYVMSKSIYALLPIARQTKAAINYMHKLANEVIKTKKLARNVQNGKNESIQNDHVVPDQSERKAFLDLLLDLRDTGNASLSDDKVRAQVDTFLFAGHDTTKTSVCWALFCIGNYPKCQEKIHEELEEVFKDSQEPATVQEILQLKYLDRVIKETRRLYPPVPTLGRKLEHDTKIGDYIIPTDVRIFISIILLHRNPALWPDPLKFDPDRFLPENTKDMHPYAYIPFSAGPRNCIGQKFAMLEEKILLTAILRKWRVKCVETPENIITKAAITLIPSQGIHFHFVPKQ